MKLQTLFIVLCVPLLLMQQSSAQSCGRRKTSRIVGGQNTGINEFTMLAGLTQTTNAQIFCGATILSNYYLVSADHCVAGRPTSTMLVLTGDWDYASSTDTPYAAVYRVQKYITHPSYNPATSANDISLIKTQTSIAFNVAVGPVCLPPTNLLFTGSTVEAVGWGTTSFGGPLSTIPKKVQLGVISNDNCRSAYSYITSSQICTYASGRDSCQYDSGGPIFVMLNGLVNLAGIISAGRGCGTNHPSLNTRVTSFIPWIVQNAR